MSRTGKDIKALPYPVYFYCVLVLAFCGVLISAYLVRSHYLNYTDIDYQSFCAISSSINCDTVSQSSYSIVLGIPVSIWGIVGFLLLLGIVMLAWRRHAFEARVWAAIFWISLLFSLISLGFAAISTFVIHSYCILCIGIYLVSFFSLWYSWLIRRRFSAFGLMSDTVADLKYMWLRRRLMIPLLSVVLAGIIAVLVFMPSYWEMKPPRLSKDIPAGINDAGHPWLGAKHPVVEIVVFSDYQCFQCKKLHLYLRRLVERYPAKLRVVHRHFPMDHEVNPIVKEPVHRGSGKMALMAIYAAGKDRFWPMNDALYQIAGHRDAIDLKWLSLKTGLDAVDLYRSLGNPQVQRRLAIDISDGIRLGITGTPSFLVDGKVYSSVIPADIIDRILVKGAPGLQGSE